MPTYDYQCAACGDVSEVVHPMSESGPTTCARCGGSLRRMLYPAGIIFKGRGFYTTDSRKRPAVESKTDGSTTGTAATPGAAE